MIEFSGHSGPICLFLLAIIQLAFIIVVELNTESHARQKF